MKRKYSVAGTSAGLGGAVGYIAVFAAQKFGLEIGPNEAAQLVAAVAIIVGAIAGAWGVEHTTNEAQ